MCYHAKPYCPGQRLLGSVRGWKKRIRVREGDYLTSKQNISPTVGNSRLPLQCKVKYDQNYYVCGGLPSLTTAGLSRSGLPSLATGNLDCVLSLLLRMIGTAGISSAFSHYCWWWSGLERSGLPSLTTPEDDLDCLLLLLLNVVKCGTEISLHSNVQDSIKVVQKVKFYSNDRPPCLAQCRNLESIWSQLVYCRYCSCLWLLGCPTIGAGVRSPVALRFTFRWRTCCCERSKIWAISAIDKLRPNALQIPALCQALKSVLDRVFGLDVAMIKMHWILVK